MDIFGFIFVIGAVFGVIAILVQAIETHDQIRQDIRNQEKALLRYESSLIATFDCESQLIEVQNLVSKIDKENIRHDYEEVVKKSKETASIMNQTLNKRCSYCRHKLAVRVNRKTGEQFLGCSQWPRCNFTKPIPNGEYK